MKLKYFEWSSKMSKTIKSLAVVALLATPTFAAAQGIPSIAASLSASFDSNQAAAAVGDFSAGSLTNVTAPTSVSVAGAIGLVATATASATADASSATSASSADADLAPTLTVNLSAAGYESTVAFTPVIDAEEIAALVCANVFSASQETSTFDVSTQTVEVVNGNGNQLTTVSRTVDLNNGAITVDCNAPV
jgi:hypothetical protein